MTKERANAGKAGTPSQGPGRVDLAMTTGDSSVFIALIEPYRRELHVHCYRFLGSLEDAEDLVQETLLRAWQHFDTFKGHASLRTWLYSIATNACLDTLKKRRPRTLPAAASHAMSSRAPIAPAPAESLWLDPYPDRWLAEAPDNPEARYSRRESVSLAFLTVLQVLPPYQRAVVLLSDVLDWHASEVARLLSTSVSAVNSALHRARVTLAKNYHPEKHQWMQVDAVDSLTSELLQRYMTAWETDDIDGLVALLKEDAAMSMPPSPSWFWGRGAIRAFLSSTAFGSGGSEAWSQWRLYTTGANGQQAFIVYRADKSHDSWQAFGIQVVTLEGSETTRLIADVTTFTIPSLVTAFGFPLELLR
jgi:RNA polymerase sigma-70 factor, ECF subfamily